MRTMRRSDNLTIFILFFGLALIEATREGHWPAVIFWLAIGAFFLRADHSPSRGRSRSHPLIR
jgi:hypothetical protein